MYPEVPAFGDEVVESGVATADEDGGKPSNARCEGVSGMSVMLSFCET